ncbi:MAG: 2-amino-4-hydroxy-6-hydroxymethyldihydropteridine diphosphokinase [Oscillospiraceae bacterium]|jgi:2-amino-4-hydroxy-6-hydroxymethyldihydropteridine diphosphokinase|nr:2-amino-4-hydroxy-6-hydroxymethyldihydropteridine diphosphokinase [Oscillospiraceae bacterium]
MSEAVVGLGSNLGDKSGYLLEAVQALSRLPGTKITGISAIYASGPENRPPDQEDYQNMAVKVDTGMSPMALLGACLGIEAAMGRVRAAKGASRVIDLDLLLYEGVKNESFELSLPHPRLLQRAFVLLPLKELYPAGRAPGIFFEPYLKEMDTGGVRKLARRIEME